MNGASWNLAEYDEGFGKAEMPTGDFDKLPDGAYFCKVERAEIKQCAKGKNKGKPMILVGMIVQSGDYANRWIWKVMVPSMDPQRMGFVKRDLANLGLEPSRLSDLPNMLDSCVGRDVDVSLVTKGEFQNVYLQQAAPQAPDDDIPF